jgi:hypothetical protein
MIKSWLLRRVDVLTFENSIAQCLAHQGSSFDTQCYFNLGDFSHEKCLGNEFRKLRQYSVGETMQRETATNL